METTRGFVGLAVELAAGMQRRHHDLERRAAGEFRVVLHRDATAVVGDRQVAVGAEMHLDPAGMSGNGLVHRVVDDFGEQVMQGVGIGAADIHARAAAHRLQALEDLDVGGRVRRGVRHVGRDRRRSRGRGRGNRPCHAGRLVIRAEQVFDRRHEISVPGANRRPSKL